MLFASCHVGELKTIPEFPAEESEFTQRLELNNRERPHEVLSPDRAMYGVLCGGVIWSIIYANAKQ